MSAGPRCYLTVRSDGAEPASLSEAARILRDGGLVAFPTETVYGLGADATNPRAIDRLNRVKGRPPEKPYSLHLYAAEQMRPHVTTIPAVAAKLMERFWPGPLTIILPGKEGQMVGFRLPDHPIARAFLKACDVPVVAPSANRSGAPPPTDAAEVVAALGSDIDCLLDGGPTRFGRESTVVEVSGQRVEIRREGALSRDTILAAVSEFGVRWEGA